MLGPLQKQPSQDTVNSLPRRPFSLDSPPSKRRRSGALRRLSPLPAKSTISLGESEDQDSPRTNDAAGYVRPKPTPFTLHVSIYDNYTGPLQPTITTSTTTIVPYVDISQGLRLVTSTEPRLFEVSTGWSKFPQCEFQDWKLQGVLEKEMIGSGVVGRGRHKLVVFVCCQLQVNRRVLTHSLKARSLENQNLVFSALLIKRGQARPDIDIATELEGQLVAASLGDHFQRMFESSCRKAKDSGGPMSYAGL